jgi:hypothetical protein
MSRLAFVFDELSLLVPHVLRDYTVAAEGNPLHELVEPLALRRRRLDLVA